MNTHNFYNTMKFAGCNGAKYPPNFLNCKRSNSICKLVNFKSFIPQTPCSFLWLAQLAYVANIVGILNSLNLVLRRKDVTVFNVQDKVKAVHTKNCGTPAFTNDFTVSQLLNISCVCP